MSRLLVNRDGGTSNEYGTFAALGRLFTGDVIEGFQVVPNGTPNMTVKVNPGSGRITTGTYPSSYGYFVSHDTTGGESVTIATAAASPRIDYIVAYVDKSVTPSASPGNVNNTNNIFKFSAVAGTPSGSPVVPTVGQIQTAIGAANPYMILAQVAVGASVSTITTPNISDVRNMAYSTAKVSSPNIDFTTFGGATTQWQSWIPILTNFTGTVTIARYTLVGKICHFYLQVTQGASVTGRHTFSLPVQATAGTVSTIGWGVPIARGEILDLGSNAYDAFGGILTSTTCGLGYMAVASSIVSQAPTSGSAPMVWANGNDQFWLYGSYETV